MDSWILNNKSSNTTFSTIFPQLLSWHVVIGGNKSDVGSELM